MTTTKTAATKTAPKTTTQSTNEKAAETPEIMSFANGAEWAETAKEQFETMVSSFTGNFEEIRDQAQELAETAQERIKTAQDRAAATNARLMEAAQEEVTEAVQFASEIGKAKTFADALEVQQSYWTGLFETRMERARELTQATVDVARETMTPADMPFANMKAFEKFFAFPSKA